MEHADFAELLDLVFPLAEEELRNEGSFVPFGGGITSETQIELLRLGDEDEDDDELQPSEDVIEDIVTRLRERATRGELTASVLCFNARVSDDEQGVETDAICAQLEDADGFAIDVFYPYARNAAGEYEFGESFAWEGEPRIFPVSGDSGTAADDDAESDDEPRA